MAGPEGPPVPQGQPNKSQGPGAFGPRPWLSGRFAPSRRPPPPGPRRFRRRPQMAGRQGRPAGRGAARARTRRQSRCPRPTGSGGGRGWPRAAALGRPLPLGRDCRRARSTAVRAAPPCAQHGQIFMHTSQARQITVRRLPTDLASPTRCTLREAGKRGLGS